jgi:hypothetical protein
MGALVGIVAITFIASVALAADDFFPWSPCCSMAILRFTVKKQIPISNISQVNVGTARERAAMSPRGNEVLP